MKVRYGLLLAVMLAVIFAGAVFTDTASATEPSIHITNLPDHVNADSDYLTSDGCVDIELIPDPGYLFKGGTVVEYVLGSSDSVSVPLAYAQSTVTLSFTGITEDMDLNITDATVLEQFIVTIEIDPSAKCTTTYTDYAVLCGENREIDIHPPEDYEFNVGENLIYNLGSENDIPYEIKEGDENGFSLIVENVTEDITLRITSAPVTKTVFTVTVDPNGFNVHSEETSYKVYCGDTLEIAIVANDNYYFLKDTIFTFTQIEENDISYEVETDSQLFHLITKPIVGDTELTIESIVSLPVRYYATIGNNGYSSNYIQDISLSSFNPTRITKGSLYLTGDANGYLMMSAGVDVIIDDEPAVEHYDTRIFQYDGGYNSYFEISKNEVLVHVVNGVITQVIMAPGSSLVETENCNDPATVVSGTIINDTESDCVLTYDSTWIIDLPISAYKAYTFDLRTDAYTLHFMKDVPSTFNSTENMDGCYLFLCNSTDSEDTTITVSGFAAIFQNCTGFGLLNWGELLGIGGSTSGPYTVVERNGMVKSVTLGPQGYIESDSKTYVNSDPDSDRTFTFDANGVVNGGFVIGIKDAADGITTYYSTIDAIVGDTSVLSFGDELVFAEEFNSSEGITLDSGLSVRSYGATNAVKVVDGDARFKIVDGKIVWIIVPENATLIDGSGMTVSVAKKGTADIEIKMDASGENISAVYLGGSSKLFTTLHDEGTITIDDVTVKNELGYDIEVMNTAGEEIIIKESSGNYVILEHNNTFTVCSADDAIDGAVSGDNIRIYGNASTSGDRNTVMTKAGFAHDDWDSLFRVLGAGVSVDGVPVTTTDPKYVHIENGELFVVKYYGYDANSITDLSRRWIWYESNLLCEYGAVNNTVFNSDSKSVYTEVPGEDRTVTYYDSWFTAKVWPYVEALETHTGTIAYNFSSTFSTPLLKKIMMYDAAYIDSYSFGCLPNLEYLYFDGPIIYAQSFYQCYALKEAVCPNVITINNSAFRECTSLKNVTCPKVEIIGDYAFSGCTALITIDGRSVSNSTVLSYIGMNAFYNCSSLERVVMPKATEVKAYAFYQCTSLTGTSLPSVTAIRSYAFYKCNNLTLMDLSAVRTIEKYAFYECRNLGNLYLPEAEIIENSAFRGASNGDGLNRTFEAGIAARSIYIPKVTTIYGMAFAGCANLETVIAPSLINVYGYAFFGCSELKTFDAPYLISADGTDPYSGDKGYAFSFCTSLVSFNAPELTGLGQYFFYGCTNLVDVNIEDVATIGQHAFAGCSSIETLNLPSVSVIEPYAFNGATMGTGTTMTVLGACTALRSVYMPNVNDVAHRAFAGCTGLESVVATNAGSIREYAFYKCTSLKSFDAPKLTVLDPYAFTFDEALTHLDIRSVVTVKDYAFYDCSSLEYVNIHSALTICRYAFYNCNELEVIDTHSVTEIKMYAFYDCLSLQHLDAPYLITIEDYAFRNDSAMIDANIPCVKSIGSEAFRNCEKLSSVNMPSVENLSNYCFSGTGLTSLSFGNDDAKYPVDSTIVIKGSAFENCSDLVTVVIGQSSNVTIDTGMNDRIFKDCSLLENVDIGKITRIGYRMFYNCTNLVSCDVVWVENVEKSSFESCSSLDTLTIGAVENNIGTTNSPGPVATHLKTLTVGNIGNCVNANAFNSCDGLMTVELGNISTLGQCAFANCSAMTSFKCGMIHEVGSNAFYKCTNLEEIQIGGADIVNAYIFYECTALKYFNVESVPENEGVFDLTDFVINEDSRYCFYKCSSLKKVYLDDGTTCIPTGCFESCSGMEEMHGNNVIEICCYGISGTSSLTLIDLNRSTDEHVIISLFNNHSLWHSANEVHIGGFVVTSGDEIGKQKTLTLTNCTVNPYHPNGTISMAMTIGSGTSSNDVGYKYVVLNDGAEVRNYTFSGMQIINTLTINGDAIIGENAFRGCVNLESVTIIDCSPQFGKGAFEGCTSLISFTADDDSSPTFSAETFLGCSSLETFDVMNLTVITDKMFSGCSSLKTFNGDIKVLNLPNVTSVEDNAFSGCSKFESIRFGVYLTRIGNNAFKDVLSGPSKPATQLIFPNSLTYIGEGAFGSTNGNGSYNVISIPSSVIAIGKDAFSARAHLTIYFNGNIDQDDPASTKMAYGAFYANGNINLYMWEEQTYLDLSDYISGKISVVKNGEHHAQVWMSADGMVCTYNSAVLLNNGYIILPYGETSTSELGKNPATLYFGMSTSTVSAPQLALLNVRGDHDSVAKSGDYFRPVISYTMSDDLHLYYSGSTLPSGAGGGIVIDADMDQGLDKPAGWVFDTKEYWYRDEIVLPTFGGTTYVKDTVYGENAVTDLYGSHAEFYPSSVKMTLGYIETCFIVTVEPFPTPVHWVDAEGIRTTFVYFGETVDELPEAHDKAAYHFLWWSTVEGSYEEYDMVVPGLTIITEIETSFYAIYAPNTYYVKIYCSSPIDISGYVVDPNTGDEYFTMSGAFSFYMDGDKGEVYYKDNDHTTYTLMFAAATWQEGYRFSDFVYKGIQVEGISAKEEYSPELGDGIVYTIEMSMIERTYSLHLQFLDANDYQPLDNEYVVIGDFIGQKRSYEVNTEDMTVTGILYSDLKNKVIIPKPLYDNTVNRYTYNNMAKNVTYGYTNIQKDDDQNLYINYESFRVTGGAKTDDITIAYYFDVGMYNIKYIYDDDAGTIYYNPVTVQEGTKVSIANAEGKVKTGYIFDKWVVLTADGEETSIKFAAGEMMTINSHITVNGDSTNTIVLKGSWTPKTVTITFDLGAYPGTEPSITQKVSETFALPDGSGYDRTGYDLTGWYFVDGGSVYTTLTLTPAIYAAYVQEGEILPMYANWVIKTYSFEVKHYDPDDPTTIDCPTVDRYSATYSYQYLSCPVELWAADPKDISEQFRTLIGWMVTYTYEELGEEYTITVEIPIGSYQISESTWQKLAEIAKRQGSDTFQCCQVWEEKTYLLYFDTNGGGALQYNTLGPLKINERFNVYSGDTLNKRGYTFSGWYCGTDVATVYTPSLDPEVEKYTLTTTMALMAVDDIITFTAIWTPLYHILYDANGGAGQVPTDPTTYIVGDNIVLASYETLKGTNGSKKIIGWNTDRNANDAVTVSTFSESLAQSADKDHNVRFYAVWIDVITYTVGVDLDGAAADHIPYGWIQQQDTNTYAKQIETGTPVKEMMNEWNGVKMTKEGYIFTSWGYTSSTVVSDMTIVCNFGKVENDKVAVDASDNTYVEFKQEFINELKEDAKDKDLSLAVALSEGTVVFDKGAISALSDSTVLSLNKVDKTAMSDADKKLVGDSPVFEIDFGNNRYFGDGNVTITLPYTLKSGENPDNIEIFHLKNGKVAEKMSCTYENGFVSFSTNHFSTYAIVNESYSESNGGGVNIGLIIGGIVGAIAVILIAVYLIKFRKKGEGAEDQ